jgi:hypothetical protein
LGVWPSCSDPAPLSLPFPISIFSLFLSHRSFLSLLLLPSSTSPAQAHRRFLTGIDSSSTRWPVKEGRWLSAAGDLVPPQPRSACISSRRARSAEEVHARRGAGSAAWGGELGRRRRCTCPNGSPLSPWPPSSRDAGLVSNLYGEGDGWVDTFPHTRWSSRRPPYEWKIDSAGQSLRLW